MIKNIWKTAFYTGLTALAFYLAAPNAQAIEKKQNTDKKAKTEQISQTKDKSLEETIGTDKYQKPTPIQELVLPSEDASYLTYQIQANDIMWNLLEDSDSTLTGNKIYHELNNLWMLQTKYTTSSFDDLMMWKVDDRFRTKPDSIGKTHLIKITDDELRGGRPGDGIIFDRIRPGQKISYTKQELEDIDCTPAQQEYFTQILVDKGFAEKHGEIYDLDLDKLMAEKINELVGSVNDINGKLFVFNNELYKIKIDNTDIKEDIEQIKKDLKDQKKKSSSTEGNTDFALGVEGDKEYKFVSAHIGNRIKKSNWFFGLDVDLGFRTSEDNPVYFDQRREDGTLSHRTVEKTDITGNTIRTVPTLTNYNVLGPFGFNLGAGPEVLYTTKAKEVVQQNYNALENPLGVPHTIYMPDESDLKTGMAIKAGLTTNLGKGWHVDANYTRSMIEKLKPRNGISFKIGKIF